MKSNMTYCLDVELFIKEVQKHPEIWDFNNEDHRFKTKKQEAWEKISNIFITDFKNLPEEEKIDVYRKLHGKWRNIRDSFVRHLKKTDGKKSYMYARHLQFLNQLYNSKSDNVENDAEYDDDDDDGSSITWQSDSDEVKSKNSGKKRKLLKMNTSNDCLDVELFIKEVQKHPEIWDFNNEDHRFKTKKQEAWEKISNIFITDFEYLPEEEKIDVYRKLQGKWRNIRDSFVRHLKKTDGKKSYMYARHLQFLNQLYNSKSDNVENDAEDDDDDDDGSSITWQSDSDEVKSKNSGKKRKLLKMNTSNILLDDNDSESTMDNFEKRVCKKEDTIEFVNTPFTEGKCSYPNYSVEDEDRAFFESLLPAVREFGMDQKLEFRSQVICLIKSIRADRNFE